MPVKLNGLPAHVLLIHAVIVLVPLAALMLAASAVWPAARAKLGFLTPAVALVALILVPVTTNAGEWLQDHLPGNQGHADPRIVRHADLGDTLLWWAIGLFVVAAALWWFSRTYDFAWRAAPAPSTDDAGQEPALASARRALPVWVTAVVAVIAVGISVGSIVQLYRIGDSGSKAVWQGRVPG